MISITSVYQLPSFVDKFCAYFKPQRYNRCRSVRIIIDTVLLLCIVLAHTQRELPESLIPDTAIDSIVELQEGE